MKYKSYSNCDYIKIYESEDGKTAVGLRGSLNNYWTEKIYCDNAGVSYKTEKLKEYKGRLTDIKSRALKELTEIKRELENE